MKEKRTRIRRKNAGYKKMVLLLIIAFILILIVTKIIFPATVSLSRYVYSVAKGVYLNSKEFYFTSNRLGKGSNQYEIKNWGGTDPYPISISMYSRKNSLKKMEAEQYDEVTHKSDMDINYELSIEVTAYRYQSTGNPIELGETIRLDKTTSNTKENDYIIVHIDKTESTILAFSNQDDFNITVTPKTTNYQFNNDDYVELKMTANAISPYTDEISGTYRVVVGKEGLSYKIEDSANNPYLNVILTNASNDGETKYINLEFNPADIVLDTTSNEYITAQNAGGDWLTTESVDGRYFNKIKIGLQSLESKFVKFYKTDVTRDYSYPKETNESIVTVKDNDGNQI